MSWNTILVQEHWEFMGKLAFVIWIILWPYKMKWWCLFCFTTVSWGFSWSNKLVSFHQGSRGGGGVGVRIISIGALCLHTEFLGQLRKGPLEARIWFLCIHGGKNTDSIYGKIIMLKALRVHRELPLKILGLGWTLNFWVFWEIPPRFGVCLGHPICVCGSCQLGSFLVPLFDSPFVE